MPSTENYITQSAADARYQALGGLSDSAPAQVDAGDTGSAGVSSSASRADHEHPVGIDSSDLVPAAWLAAWTSYTPTDANITVGNGTRTAAYIRVGRVIHFRWRLVLGSTSAIASGARVGLPVASVNVEQSCPAHYLDSGTRNWVGVAAINRVSVTTADLLHTESGGSGGLDATSPFTWTTSDTITVAGTYEAAA